MSKQNKRDPLVKIRLARPRTGVQYEATVPVQHWIGFIKGTPLRIGNEIVIVAKGCFDYPCGAVDVIRA